jgi:hypothetical protein
VVPAIIIAVLGFMEIETGDAWVTVNIAVLVNPRLVALTVHVPALAEVNTFPLKEPPASSSTVKVEELVVSQLFPK